MKRLIEVDPLSGVQTWHDYDDATDTTYIQTVQDAEPILEGNKQLQNDPGYGRLGLKNEMQHVARIPVALLDKWFVEDGINVFDKSHWPRVKRKLEDPAYRYLRTSLGKL